LRAGAAGGGAVLLAFSPAHPMIPQSPIDNRYVTRLMVVNIPLRSKSPKSGPKM
jgi:hypothetical protein